MAYIVAVYSVLSGFGEEDIDMTETDSEHLLRGAVPLVSI